MSRHHTYPRGKGPSSDLLAGLREGVGGWR